MEDEMTPSMARDVQASDAWQALVGTARQRLDALAREAITMDLASDAAVVKLAHLQGQAAGIEFVLSLPEIVLTVDAARKILERGRP